ncbi:MAG: GNAT family N-acetyltransferase [Alphaproteobacteria bacterium]|nr:GNAT family N-acetyltransferase [Alphaproteobacteria bacterium]
MPIELVKPAPQFLEGYIDALHQGWSPDNVRGRAAAEEHLTRIAQDANAFLASLDDPDAMGAPVKLPDGSLVPRLPGFVRWIWDGAFCGSIGFRWQAGTSALPAHVLGHIGYSTVPWKQGRGYATRALKQLLPLARERGLDYVELTTDPANIPSQRVITGNGGVLIEEFVKAAVYGGGKSLRYRIWL